MNFFDAVTFTWTVRSTALEPKDTGASSSKMRTCGSYSAGIAPVKGDAPSAFDSMTCLRLVLAVRAAISSGVVLASGTRKRP